MLKKRVAVVALFYMESMHRFKQNLTYFPYKKEKRRKLNMKKRNEKRSLDRVTGRKR